MGEAEVFADAGYANLFIAYRVWPSGARGLRLRELAQRCTIRVCVDFAAAAAAEPLARALAGTDAGAVAALVTELVRDVRHELSGHRVLPQRPRRHALQRQNRPQAHEVARAGGGVPGPAAGQGGQERWRPSGPATDVPLTISKAYRASVHEDTGSGGATAGPERCRPFLAKSDRCGG